MKKSVILFLQAIIMFGCFAEGIKLFAPVAQGMLVDKKDYVRYSPINLFDDKSETVFAVTYGEINKDKPLLEIWFSDPAEFDRLTIKAGYFDKKYYSKNNRIKRLNVKIINGAYTEYNRSVDLNDKMVEQDLYVGNKIKATKIEIYIKEVFPGTQWNDLVVSDLSFYKNNKKQTVALQDGECMNEFFTQIYEYDAQSRLIHEFGQYGKVTSVDKYYKYENNRIYMATVDMYDDSNELKFTQIDSIEMEDSKGKQFFLKNGRVVAEKYSDKDTFYINQYIYNDKNQLVYVVRICENYPFGNRFIKYSYNEKGLLVEKSSYQESNGGVNLY